MATVTSFHRSAVTPDELSGIVADHLALEHAQIFRRLLVTRCGLLALATAVMGLVFHWLSPFASWFSVGVFLMPPAWAWVVEIRRHARLRRRLDVRPGIPQGLSDRGRAL